MDAPGPGVAAPARPVIAVLWPAFLAACALELVVFAAFDPADFHAFGDEAPSDIAVLSIAFFVFWAITATAGYVTLRIAGSGR